MYLCKSFTITSGSKLLVPVLCTSLQWVMESIFQILDKHLLELDIFVGVNFSTTDVSTNPLIEKSFACCNIILQKNNCVNWTPLTELTWGSQIVRFQKKLPEYIYLYLTESDFVNINSPFFCTISLFHTVKNCVRTTPLVTK